MATADIPVFDIVGGSLSRVFGRLGQVFSVGLLPMILYFVISVVGTIVAINMPNSQLLSSVISLLGWLVLGFFIIAWHRVVLEGYKDGASKAKFEFGPREQKFFGFYVLFAVVTFIATVICTALIVTSGTVGYIVTIVVVLALIYVFTRLQIVFPASAIGEPTSLAIAWRESAGAFLQMFAINVVLVIVLFLAALIIGLVIGIIVALFAATGSVIVVAIVGSLLSTILYFILVAVFTTAVSLVYRKLVPGPLPA